MDGQAPIDDNPLSRILVTALDIEATAERDKYIEEACAGDDEMLKELKSLLSFADTDDSFVGKKLGKYVIKEEIGRGGMGIVYLAARTKDFNHTAAVKIINQVSLTKDDLRRFAREMRIMSGLVHPNIARLIDGGVTKKRPYFLMDHVRGCRIDEYCDRGKLSVRERVEMFRKVCTAVKYLHGKRVVHRDIKPSNIIVTGQGEPVIIDFGIAHVISSAAAAGTNDLTNLIQHAFSREYASPEQARGDRTVRETTDVYSLGAVLYELATGIKPHRFKSNELVEVTRVICEDDPVEPRRAVTVLEASGRTEDGGNDARLQTVCAARNCTPKQLRKTLSGDLDHIIKKALRKEPLRRYPDVDSLIEDIDRYLEEKPVKARQGSWWYRLDKKAAELLRAVPPAGLNWMPKAAVYFCLLLLCLTVWQFPRMKRWLAISYHLAASENTGEGIMLPEGKAANFRRAGESLKRHLNSEMVAQQHKWEKNVGGHNAWTVSQMVTSLEGLVPINVPFVAKFLKEKEDQECYCWYEGAKDKSNRDLRVSSWVLLGMSRVGLKADDGQIDFLINTMQPDGWWSTYTNYPGGRDDRLDQKYASTYATATALTALQGQLQLGLSEPHKEGLVRDAITRGGAWLMKTRIPGRARWWDYPFNSRKRELVTVSATTLHTLHRISNGSAELTEIDRLWLDELPELETDVRAEGFLEHSSVVIDPFNVKDASTHFPLPPSILAAVDAYPSGSPLQKAKATVWLGDIAENMEAVTGGVSGEWDWFAAELLIALRSLQSPA